MTETKAPARDLRALFDPQSLAILGASNAPNKWGYWLARSALKGVKRRRVYLVNRQGRDILGQPAFRSLRDVPQPVELVVVSVPAAGFEEAVADSLAAGARAIVAITAGLGEVGPEGQAIEQAAAARVRAAGAVLVGPNCLGLADTGTRLDLAYSEFAAGPVGLISQSGNLALELALIADEAGVGFSRFVSVGNQADLDVTDFMRDFAEHDETRVIAVYAEEFRDGRELAAAALHALEAGKPVILLTVGSSNAGARAARSHTGALVSTSVAVDAACRASGMIRVSTPRQMIELAQGLLMRHFPKGRRVAIFGDGGGHVALAADLVAEQGMQLPLLSEGLAADIGSTLPPRAATRNPVDLAGGGEEDFSNFDRVVRKLATSAEIDSVLLTGYFGGYSLESADFARRELQVALAMVGTAEENDCPLIVQTMYPASPAIRAMRSRRVAVYSDINAAVQVLARLVGRVERPPSGVPPLPESLTLPPIREGYFEARNLMMGAGIPFVRARRVATLREAKAEASELGFPIVLKALGSSHKSDLGAVKLGIRTDAELEAAFVDISHRLKPPGFSVEVMADSVDGIELIVGVRRDPSFGPVVVIGMGGVYAELLDDVAVALAPLSQEVTEQLIRSLRGAPLLLGARGHPALAIGAAAAVAVSLSQLAVERAAIIELEINPLLVTPKEVLALDARVVLRTQN